MNCSKLKIVVSWLLLLLSASKPFAQANLKAADGAYFYMDMNGLKYAYNHHGNAVIKSQRNYDQANEVTSYYTYYDNGKSHNMKYNAGLQNYQPAMLQYNTAVSPVVAPRLDLAPAVTTTAAGTYDSLKFVQDSLRMMQGQPLRISFTSRSSNQQVQPQHVAPLYAPQQSSINMATGQLNQPITQAYSNVIKKPNNDAYNFAFNAPQMSHSQRADPAGNVAGKYSYYDEAGFHEMTYKAGDGIGFVVMGGNLMPSGDSSQLNSNTNEVAASATQRLAMNYRQPIVVAPLNGNEVNYNYGDREALSKYSRFT